MGGGPYARLKFGELFLRSYGELTPSAARVTVCQVLRFLDADPHHPLLVLSRLPTTLQQRRFFGAQLSESPGVAVLFAENSVDGFITVTLCCRVA
jgi:hypothetical protein